MLLEVKDFSSYPLRSKDFSSNAGNQTLPQRPVNYSSLLLSTPGVGDQASSAGFHLGWKPGEAQSRRLLIPMAPRVLCGAQAELLSVLAIMNTDSAGILNSMGFC